MAISETVQLALIVAIPTLLTGFVAPVIALWLSNRGKATDAALAAKLRAEEKRADWARQDAVAEKQAILAAQQIATAESAARRVDQVAKQAKEAAELLVVRQDASAFQQQEQSAIMRATSAKVDVVHGLVNSQYTAALQSEMDATVALLAVLEELVGMKTVQGQPVEQTTKDAISATKRKIGELRITLNERQAQAKTADKATAQIAADPTMTTSVPVADTQAQARLSSIDDQLKKQTAAIIKKVVEVLPDKTGK